ncbi:putative topoisomerase [uncultured Caudovirales phage]|uniref:Putative topoisomerase n=1 Tax=uncultured Caudovirales phage TaxID=2100421 RepID=A0A2H4J5F4_9CAUD|nr:putative topoisomerase [uncultured Caudovirales phage]
MAEQPNFSDKFRELNSRDVSAHVEKKQNLNYLSWAYVQQELTKEDPNYTERVIEFPYPDSTNENFFVPYLKTNEGYMVCVELTVFGVTKREWLPVLDFRNKPVTVGSATAIFDINKATKRCMVKCAAKFGLGNYLYLGEETPSPNEKDITELEERINQFVTLSQEKGRDATLDKTMRWLGIQNINNINQKDIAAAHQKLDGGLKQLDKENGND